MEPTTMITWALSVLSAVGTAVWTVWTWHEHHDEALKHEQEKLKHEKDLVASEYLNPFVLSAVVLRTHIYELLHGDALRSAKSLNGKEYEIASPATFETLYLFSSYFFWEYCFLRYGPYVKDRQALTLFTQVSRILSSREYPGEAFRFSDSEQLALGMFNMHGMHSSRDTSFQQSESILPSLRNLTLYEFIEKMTQELQKPSAMSQSHAIRKTLEALESAERIQDLAGYERLLAVEKPLIDVIEYCKADQGLAPDHQSLPKTHGETDKVIWLKPAANDPQVVHRCAGRLRLSVPRLRQNWIYAERLQAEIESLPRIATVKLNQASSSVVITCDPELNIADVERDVLSAIAKLDSPRSA
jgi:hypothetical protein